MPHIFGFFNSGLRGAHSLLTGRLEDNVRANKREKNCPRSYTIRSGKMTKQPIVKQPSQPTYTTEYTI